MTNAACQQGKAEQVYIKRKCGHSILLDTVFCLTQCVGHNNLLVPQYFGYWFRFSIFGNCKRKMKSVDILPEVLGTISSIKESKLDKKYIYTFQICEISEFRPYWK